jgi:hypothetical protein
VPYLPFKKKTIILATMINSYWAFLASCKQGRTYLQSAAISTYIQYIYSSVAGLHPFKRNEKFREKRTSSHFFIGEKDTYLFLRPLY